MEDLGETALTEVERFLLRLGLPRKVVDVFKDEGCDDLSAFMYLRPEDLDGLGLAMAMAEAGLGGRGGGGGGGGTGDRGDEGEDDAAATAATAASAVHRAVLAGVDEIKVQTDHAWEDAATEDGRPFYFNPVTQEARWERPAKPWRKPRFDIDWQLTLPNSPLWDGDDGLGGGFGDADDTDGIDEANFPLPAPRSGAKSYFDLVVDDEFEHEDPPMEAWAPLLGVPYDALPATLQQQQQYADTPPRTRMVIEVGDEGAGGLHFDLSPTYADSDGNRWGGRDDGGGSGDVTRDWGEEIHVAAAAAAAATSESQQWYVCTDSETGATEGPFSPDDLKSWLETGAAEANTLVTDYSTQDWHTLEEAVQWFDRQEHNEPDQYLLSPEGVVLGPYWADDVASWITYGELLPGTYVKQGEDGQWTSVFGAHDDNDDDDDNDYGNGEDDEHYDDGGDASRGLVMEDYDEGAYRGEDYKEEHAHEIKQDYEEQTFGLDEYKIEERQFGEEVQQQHQEHHHEQQYSQQYSQHQQLYHQQQHVEDVSSTAESGDPEDGRAIELESASAFAVREVADAADTPADSASAADSQRPLQASNTSPRRLFAPFYAGAGQFSPSEQWRRASELSRRASSEPGLAEVVEDAMGDVQPTKADVEELLEEALPAKEEDEEGEEVEEEEEDAFAEASASSHDRYFYVAGVEGDVEGPYGLSDLAAWYHSGMVEPESLVCEAETEDWLTLASVVVAEEREEQLADVPDEWYMLSETGDMLGPFPYWNLYTWYTSEQIAGEQLVAGPGMEDWVELGSAMADKPATEEAADEEDFEEGGEAEEAGTEEEMEDAQAEVYVLNPEGETQGPYPYSHVVHWFFSGDIDSETWISISGGDWEVASSALSRHSWDNEPNNGSSNESDDSDDEDGEEEVEEYDEERFDEEGVAAEAEAIPGPAVYVSVDGDVQGPYPVVHIESWLAEGSIDIDNWMSIDGSDWMPIREHFNIA